MIGRETFSNVRFACRVALLAVVAGQLPAMHRAARADEPSGLEVMAAMQDVLADAIARGEKSVAAIARVAAKEDTRDPFMLDAQPDFFGGKVSPTDAEFIPASYATGVVVGPGLILTNHHVLSINERSAFYVTTVTKKVFPARIKARDPRSDLAVLEVSEKFAEDDFVPIAFGDGSKLRKGNIVISLGNPYAVARDGQASASWGIVSNLQRKAAPVSDDNPRPTLYHFGAIIQTDAKLNLGTSGGALLNLKGEMVGLTTSLAAVAGYEGAAGYAIPVDDAFLRVVDELKSGREVSHGLIGIIFFPDGSSPVAGVRVDRAVAGGPGSRAGIRRDDVIVRVQDQPVNTTDDLMLQIGRLAAGSIARVTLLRNGQELRKEVRLGKFPVPEGSYASTPLPSWRGLTVDYMTALNDQQTRSRIEESPADPCLIVREVAVDSPAWQAGIRRGMLISHAGNARVDTPEEFHKQVENKPGTVSLRLVEGEGRNVAIPASALPKS